MEHAIAEKLWVRATPYLTNEADVRLYEPVLQRLHSLACDEDETQFFNWCFTFWHIASFKAPKIAADHVEEFLDDIFERKQTAFASILPVGGY